MLVPTPAASAALADVPQAAAWHPTSPTIVPLDEKLPAPDGVLLIGRNATHVWMIGGKYSFVMDLATGCAVESYPWPELDEPFGKSSQDLYTDNYGAIGSQPLSKEPIRPSVEKLIADPARMVQYTEFVRTGLRFGVTDVRFSAVSWNQDGRHWFVHAAGLVFHSADAGATFAVLDDHASREARVAPDGRHVVYERCADPTPNPDRPSCPSRNWDLAARSLEGDDRPRILTRIQGAMREGFSRDGHLLKWRGFDARPCMELISVDTGAVDREICMPPIPAQYAATGNIQLVKFVGFSPGEKLAVAEWGGAHRKAAAFFAMIFDPAANAPVQMLIDQRVLVADDGRWLSSSISEGGGDHTYLQVPGKPRKLLGAAAWQDWELPGERAILISYVKGKSTMKQKRCKMIKVVSTR